MEVKFDKGCSLVSTAHYLELCEKAKRVDEAEGKLEEAKKLYVEADEMTKVYQDFISRASSNVYFYKDSANPFYSAPYKSIKLSDCISREREEAENFIYDMGLMFFLKQKRRRKRNK